MKLHRWADLKKRKLTAAEIAEIEARADQEAHQISLRSEASTADTAAPHVEPGPATHPDSAD